jgi:hypothetical protein
METGIFAARTFNPAVVKEQVLGLAASERLSYGALRPNTITSESVVKSKRGYVHASLSVLQLPPLLKSTIELYCR